MSSDDTANAITSLVENSTNSGINAYITAIVAKFPQLKEEELKELWTNMSQKSNEPEHKCVYVYVKGANQGNVCNAKVSDKSAGHSHCSKHLKYENKSPSSTPAPSDAATKTCPFVLLSGEHKGSACNQKCVTGSDFCSRHKKMKDDQERRDQEKKQKASP